MAYNINKSNSDPVTIPTGAIDNQFDIPLIGQDAINYGDDLALAFVRLLENFANTSQPSFGSSRTAGQLWYDTTPSTGGLNVYDGTQFVAIPKTSEVVQNTGNENVAGVKTFNGIPNFNGGDGSNAPFTVDSTFLVSNLNSDLLDGQEGAYYASVASTVGTNDMWIPASKMYAQTTNPAVAGSAELGTSGIMLDTWDFADGANQLNVQFNMSFPTRWDLGTVTYQVFWETASATGSDVVWGLQATSVSETVSMVSGVTFSTAVDVTDTNNGADELNKTPVSGAVTINNTPADGDTCFFRLYRNPVDANDTLAATARLIGVKIFWTSDQAID